MTPSADSSVKQERTKAKSATRSIFNSEYTKLNEQQKKAVDTIEGPLMVVAGPGTGKTQVISMRVANILKRTQMRPSNILCLTFSTSGATAMRDRLRLLIGADAYGVTVSTIHGFAQSIIDQNPILFDEWSAKEQLSDIEKYRELNTIIDQILPHSSLINAKDPYGRDTDILSRISEVKREGKTIADLERVAAEYESQMKVKSKPGTKVHEKNLLAAKKFQDFVKIFAAYQDMLERTGRYDYDDMILFTLRALEEEEWLLLNLQERYQYVLVDEFQDTNGAQWKLIDRLTRFPSLPHEPNLCVVGDDDQAIYRFQGANLQNMLGFRERFPSAPVIPLTVSYRSTQAILDAARTLIEKNDERLVGRIPGLQKMLTSAAGKEGDAPILLRPPSDTAEPWLIADLIEDRLEKGIEPEEIAVLTQTNAELFSLYDVLRARKIPVLLQGNADLLDHSLVLQILAILSAIEHPTRDGLLSAALACDCFALHPADLGRLHLAARDRKTSILDILLGFEKEKEITFSDSSRLIEVRDLLLTLHEKIPLRTVLETVENALRESGILPAAAEGDPLDLAAVEVFFRYVKDRCLMRPGYTFREFLADLHFYRDPQYGQARLTYQLPHLVTTGVQLMTAHQSKGKEFHTVILSNFREGHWDNRRKPGGVSIPEDLLFGWDKEKKAFEKNQDERRVAFVAITRAKRELLMVCPHELVVGDKSRVVSPSAFFAEAGTLTEQDSAIRNPEKASLLLHPVARELDAELRAYLQQRLEKFELSATALRRFLKDPQEFLKVDLLGQPEHFDEGSIRSLGYGSAIHWALREWAVGQKEGKPIDEQEMITAFDWYLKERTILTDNQRRDLLALGSDALPKYFAQHLAGQTPYIHAVEKAYRTREGEVPLKGKIDRIDLASATSASATVIDYKTGAPKSESDIRGSLEPGVISRTEDGEYFRQLAFYALLLEKAEPLLKTETFALEFIGEKGEHPIRRSFAITDAEKNDLRGLISDVWTKIVSLDFSPL